MAFNGTGTFNRLFVWANDKANGINITASRMDSEDSGFATGLSTCLTKDGQQTATARIPFAQGVSISAGSAGSPSLSVIGDLSSGFFQTATGAISFASLGTPVATLNATGLVLLGSASGQCTLNVAASAGTNINFRLPASNGTTGQLLQTDGSGNASWVTVGSGSGTVNSGTSAQLAYYASSTNAVSGNAQATISGGTITLGTATSTLGSIVLSGSTSGTTTLNPNVTASGTLTLPAATDTLIGKATTDTLTNKTLDTGGTGNVLKIAGTQISSISGNTSKVATTTGSLTNNHIAAFDASSNIKDGGVAPSNLMTALAVGSIILAKNNTSTMSAGTTYAAATVVSMTAGNAATGDSLTGTWLALQTQPSVATDIILMQRVT